MKHCVVTGIFLALLWSDLAAAEPAGRLKVSVTVPPRPCEYPDRCVRDNSNPVPVAATRVVISQQQISYVGSPPTVEKNNDLLVVKF